MIREQSFFIKYIIPNKFFFLCYLLFLAATARGQMRIDLGETMANEKIRVSFRDSSYVAMTDANGVASVSVRPDLKPWYAILHRPLGADYFYVTPGKQQEMTYHTDGHWDFGGEAKAINDYLNSPFLSSMNLGYTKTEDDFIDTWEQLPHRLLSHLDSLQLPEDFKNIESKRLHYVACNMLLIYPLYHTRTAGNEKYSPGERFYATLANEMTQDADATGLWEYRQVFRDYLQTLAEKAVGATGEAIDKLKYQMDYIQKNISDDILSDYLMATCLTNHIRQRGIEGTDSIVNAYKAQARNSAYKQEFERTYNQYAVLAVGKQAPEFVLNDINGKQVKLSDLRGKYVYIDVWATWCMPCCREIPHLKALEKQFEGKPIAFVSISIDKDEAAWKAKVAKEQMSGIQLHAKASNSFQRDYQVSLIPHFILIDQNGKFVNAKMTRPSDQATLEYLQSLQGLSE